MGSLSHVCPNNKLGLLAHGVRHKEQQSTLNTKVWQNGKHRAKPASLAIDPKCLTTAHTVNLPLTTSSRNGEILSWTLRLVGEWQQPLLLLPTPTFGLSAFPGAPGRSPHSHTSNRLCQELNQDLYSIHHFPTWPKMFTESCPTSAKTNTHTDSSSKTKLKCTINRNSRWPIFTSISPLPSFSFESKRNCKGHSFFQ